MSRLLTSALLATAVQALAFDGLPARATDTVLPDATFHLPEITQAPDIKELFKRQSSDQTVLIGPDNTCGYFFGRAGAPYTCNGDYTCAFVIQSTFGAVGCCNGGDCGLRATCLDYQQIYMSSSCNDGCFQDTYTAKCTNTALPYCGTVTFFSGIRDYYCAAVLNSTAQQLYTTYAGETGHNFQQVLVTSTQSGTGTGSFMISGVQTGLPSSTESSGGNNSNSNDNNNNKNKSSSAPVGAIVGGVVGGVAALALIGLATYFIIRHNKNKKPSPEQPMQQTAAASGTAPPPGAPGYPQQTYDNAAYGQQPYQQQSPSPQVYYTEQKPTGFVELSPTGAPDRHDSTSPVSQQSAQHYNPTPTFNANQSPQLGTQHIPPAVHEAGGNAVGERDYNSNHHGQFHEMSA